MRVPARLVLVRHGETVGNSSVRYYGRTDIALAELGRYRLVHFATHALLNSQHPERSGIFLSMVDRDGAPIDGFLRLQDIYNLRAQLYERGFDEIAGYQGETE